MYPLFGISYDPHSSFCVFSLYLKLLNCSIISFFDRGFSAGIHSLSLGTLYHILFAIDLLNSPSDLVFFFFLRKWVSSPERFSQHVGTCAYAAQL